VEQNAKLQFLIESYDLKISLAKADLDEINKKRTDQKGMPLFVLQNYERLSELTKLLINCYQLLQWAYIYQLFFQDNDDRINIRFQQMSLENFTSSLSDDVEYNRLNLYDQVKSNNSLQELSETKKTFEKVRFPFSKSYARFQPNSLISVKLYLIKKIEKRQ